MIKNIVFDMGKVLVAYEADAVARHFMEDEKEQKEVCTSVFVSPEWLMLDMGVISEEDALKRMQARLDTEHTREMARLCLEHWHEYNMWPIEEVGELVRWLKKRGFGIYLCSNASLRLLKCYKQVIPAIDCFDGILFSAEEKCVKPQKEIYHRLFEKFSLNPDQCFFIDDLDLNIQGAKACGMDGYCFADGDVEKLKKVLETMPDPV
ncbi:MAG: HAD family hydrolase [Lachnospiraceae bacterium]|jgi:putative hydrolase of the HAD superfamily